MHEAEILNRPKSRVMERTVTTPQYTAKDFQLEVLDRLTEVQELATSLEETWETKLKAVKEERLLKFDSRALIAMGALVLSVTGYVIQDARNSAKQDSEIAAMQARVQRLEQIAATTTEARIRTEVQLGELQAGQNEIKAMLQAHDSAGRLAKSRQ